MTFERTARGLLLLCGLAMVTYHTAGPQMVLAGDTENQAFLLGFMFAPLLLDSAARSATAAGSETTRIGMVKPAVAIPVGQSASAC